MDWFRNELKRKYCIEALLEDISAEANEFDHDEIDESMIPKEDLTLLPNPFLIETLMYISTDGVEWISGIIMDTRQRPLYVVWLKNGIRLESGFFE